MFKLSHPYMTTRKTIALIIQTFVGKVMSLHFNTLSSFVIAFLPSNKHFNFIFLLDTRRSGLRARAHPLIFNSRKVKVKVKSLSHVWLLVTPWTVAYQVPPSMGFSRQKYQSGSPFPSPGDLPDPGIEPKVSHIVGKRFTIWATKEVHVKIICLNWITQNKKFESTLTYSSYSTSSLWEKAESQT